jgi:tetratricopeptide (TPR) repeat protein
MSNFGVVLQDLIYEAGVTKKELAQRASLHPWAISRLIKAPKNRKPSSPSYDLVKKLGDGFYLIGLSKEQVDKLWHAAGYDPPNGGNQFTHASLEHLNDIFKGFPKADQDIYGSLMLKLAEILRDSSAVSQFRVERKWDLAIRQSKVAAIKRDALIERLHIVTETPAAESHYGKGEFSTTIQYYTSVLWSIRHLMKGEVSPEIRRNEADVLAALGSVYRRTGGATHWLRARESYEEALAIYEDLNEKTRAATCKRKIAGNHLVQGEAEEALPHLREALSVFEEIGDQRGIYKTLQHQAWAHDQLGEWDKAEKLFQKALKMVVEVGADDWELAKAHRYLADTYQNQERLEEAIRHYCLASQIIEKYKAVHIEVHIVAGEIWLRLAEAYANTPGREHEANVYLLEYLDKVGKFDGENFQLAHGLSNYGHIVLQQGRRNEAKKCLWQAHRILQDSGHIPYYVKCLEYLIELVYLEGDYAKVLELMREAERQNNYTLPVIRILAHIKLVVGKATLEKGPKNKAAMYFAEALELAMQYNNATVEKLLVALLHIINEFTHMGSGEEALGLCDELVRSWEGRSAHVKQQVQAHRVTNKLKQQREDINLRLLADEIVVSGRKQVSEQGGDRE